MSESLLNSRGSGENCSPSLEPQRIALHGPERSEPLKIVWTRVADGDGGLVNRPSIVAGHRDSSATVCLPGIPFSTCSAHCSAAC